MKKNSHTFYLPFLLLLFCFLLIPVNTFAQSQNPTEVIQRYENGQLTNPTLEEKSIIHSYLIERMQVGSPVERMQDTDMMLATFISENFSTATGTTPPSGWVQNIIAGDPTFDLWVFNNPGGRTLNAPIAAPAAIFDSDWYSFGGGPENVALESPTFSVPAAATVFLEWDQYFLEGYGGQINVEVFNGTSWVTVYTTTSTTPNPDFQSINISTHVAGVSNAKVRFRWVGNWSWYWIVDNVKVFSVATGLTGIKTIPGDFATIKAAVDSLNQVGVGNGGVTFNVAAGYTELLTGPIQLTASGGPLDQIIFQKSGAGANPLITAYVGTQTPGSATHDDMWRLIGADWVTIDGIDLFDPNAANPATMEGGYVLYKASDANGAQNNTIKNCVITLNRINNATGSGPSVEGSRGIEVTNALPTAATTAVTPTSPAGTNSYNKFYSNTIQNCNYGIVLSGFAATSPFDLGDTNNDIGGNISETGNTIINFGGATGATNPSAGVRANNQWGINISFNTINNNNGAGVNHPAVLRGIFGQAGTSANAVIQYNNISVYGGGTTQQVTGIENAIGSTAAGNIVAINFNSVTGNYLTATSGVFYGIYNSASAATVNITHNSVSGISYSAITNTGTGALYPIWNSGAATNVNILFNDVNNISRTGTTGGTTIGIYVSGGTNQTVNNNSVTNMSIDGTGTTSTMYGIQTGTGTIAVNNNNVANLSCVKATGTSALYGLYNISSPTDENYNYNLISNLTHAGTGVVYGLYAFTTTGVRTVSFNQIYNISGAGTTIAGINMASSSPSVFNNKIWNIQSTSTGAPTVSGILQGSLGTSGVANIYNNLIGDLKAPNATTSSATAPTIRGLNITTTTATTTINVSYNTIYLNASTTGTAFGTAGLFATASATGTTATLQLRNNIIVNNSTPLGVGLTVAYQRSSTALANYGSLSNNNDFYAGTPGASNLIFYDGTNAIQTIAAYKALVSPLDAVSFSENPNFLSTVGTSMDFLHINPAIATQIESGGIPVAGITTDYDGDLRNATTPDVGADEFNGIPLDLTPPVIVYTPLLNTSSTSSRTLTSQISDVSGVPTAGIGLPVLYWRINSGAWNSAQATHLSGTNYQFTFGSGVVVGDTVKYYVVAQDNAVPPNVGAFPSGGAGGFTANPPAAAIPPTNPSSYLITNASLAGNYTVGLLAFNAITGKNIYFEKAVSKVLKEVFVEELPKNKFSNQNEMTSASINPNGITQLVEVEEISWIPMENGKVYQGDLFVKKVEDPSLNYPEGIDGIYATITAAVADLNLRGVSAPVNFLLTDPTYPTETFPITVNVINEAKPTASSVVTFRPNTGVNATVSGAAAASQLMKIHTSYITIDGSNSGGTSRNLTFENTSVTTPQVIVVGSIGTTPITNVTVKNCFIINGVNTSTPLIVTDGTTPGNPGWFNNITLENNSIKKAYIGIYNNAFVSTGNGSGLNISFNELTTSGANSVRFTGIYVQGVDGATISDNKIAYFDGTSAEDDRGIWFASGTRNSVAQRNEIYSLKYTGTAGYGAYGVAVSSTLSNANNTIVNNLIYDISGDGWNYISIIADNPHGIYVFGTQSGIKIYYNTIHLFGNTLNQTSAISTGICLATGSTADIRDNNIVNNLGLLGATGYGSVGIFVQTSATQLLPSNYNNWFVSPTGTGVKNVGQIATTGYATLGAWQAASSQDANSISADPQFVGLTDLRPAVGSPVLAAGTPIAGITTDFLGVTRSATNPSIGAYEQGVLTPLAGDYTVGLSMFKQFSGLDITFEQRVRTIEITETIVNPEAEEQIGIYEETINGTVTIQEPADERALAPVTVTRTVEQEYYVPMLNGVEYTGPLYYEFTAEQIRDHRLTSRGVYATITAAKNDAILRGVSAAVRFLLVDATYPSETFPIVLNEIPGASAVNTVTLLPNTGVTSLISGTPSNNTIFDFNGVDYFIIDGRQNGVGTEIKLTIENLATTGTSSHTIRLINGATNNVFRYVRINNYTQPTAGPRAIDFNTSATDPAGNSFNLIQNCYIYGGRTGIGFAGTVANPNSNNVIVGNIITDFSFSGVWLSSNTTNTTIDKNEFFHSVPVVTSGTGINLATSGIINIRENKFYDLQNSTTATLRGISGTPGASSTVNIINNFFSFTLDNGTKTSIYAIQISGTTEHTANIHYNTFNFAGVHTGGTAGVVVSGGLIKSNTGATSVFNAKNNIGKNTRTGGTSGVVHTNFFVGTTAIVGTLDINYNAWYAFGDPGSYHAGWGATVYNDLTAYKAAAAPHEQQTIFKNVNFVSGVDLHLAGLSIGDADLAGLPITGITTDIDGDLRDLTYPYRGADEAGVKFLPILSPSNLVAVPDTFTCQLSWQDNSNNEGGFIIQRKDGDSLSVNPFVNIDTVGTNVTFFLDTGLNPNTTYTWRVFGFNALGVSGFSNMAVATTFIPVELTAFTAEVSGREILINWTTATELNNRGFDIERKMDGEWEKIGFKDGRGTTTEESYYSFIDKFTYESFVGTITYRLKQMDFDGTYAYSPEVEVDVDFTPKEYTLYQNYPNPFNPVTTIKYSLPFESNVRIAVYNVLGEMIAVLVDETKQVGFHDYNWNAPNLASGIYIYTIDAKSVTGDKSFNAVKKMILMK